MSAPNGRLLILDDDAEVGRTIGFVGAGLGMEVRATTEPDTFFEWLDEWPPTHIVLDLVMPQMDGVEVMRHLAARRCRAAVIVLSGVGDRVLDAARRSADEHDLVIIGALSKPFTPKELRLLLQAAGPAGQSRPASAGEQEFEPTERDLQRAIEEDQFRLVYQPKVACASGALLGFEVLVRWAHPAAGIVMPARFLPLAERLDLMGAITKRIFHRAACWMAREEPLPGLSVSVNLSGRTLANIDFADYLAGVLRDASVDPARVTLELTETAAMDDPVAALDLMTRLRVKGFHLSLDDFGTGYSSMVQLARLPFSELKVDKSFVISAPKSQESRTIIRSVVDLGHNLGLRVVAEGVEEEETLGFLRELGCDVVQGFLIGRPMPAHAIAQWMDGRRACSG